MYPHFSFLGVSSLALGLVFVASSRLTETRMLTVLDCVFNSPPPPAPRPLSRTVLMYNVHNSTASTAPRRGARRRRTFRPKQRHAKRLVVVPKVGGWGAVAM